MTIKILRIFSYCALMLLAGCAGTPEERQQMKAQGQAMYSQHSEQCYDLAWSKHPTDFQTVSTTRSRSRQMHTGMTCIAEENSNIEKCSNTYKSEPEYYTTQETRDLNKQYRDNFYGSCLTRKCQQVLGASAKDEGFTTLQGLKYSYCRQG